LKRVLVATALGTLAVAALVFFSDTTRSSSKPWERDWSSSGRDLFEEAGISPGQRPDERSPVKSDPLEMPRDSGGRDGRSEGVKWEDFKPIAPVPSRGATTSDRGQSIDDFLGGAKPAAAPEAAEKRSNRMYQTLQVANKNACSMSVWQSFEKFERRIFRRACCPSSRSRCSVMPARAFSLVWRRAEASQDGAPNINSRS